MKIWRINTSIRFPIHPVAGETLQFLSRVPQKTFLEVEDMQVNIEPQMPQIMQTDSTGQSFDIAKLSITTEAKIGLEAISKTENLIELILDNLSFQLQYAVQ